MMWGLEFHEAYNSLIIIGGEFSVSVNREINRYRFSTGTDNAWIEKLEAGNWKGIPGVYSSTFREELEKILPQKEDFGFKWDYASFLIALTFFAEGKRR